ncbi:MAG: hypothetical protein ACTSU2_07235 [Promethearchaeota archaeon]
MVVKLFNIGVLTNKNFIRSASSKNRKILFSGIISPKNNKIVIYLLFVLLGTSAFINLEIFRVNASLDDMKIIRPKGYEFIPFYPSDDKVANLTLSANSSVDVFIVNETNLARFLLNQSFSSGQDLNWTNIKELSVQINASEIFGSMGANYTYYHENHNTEYHIYILIINNDPSNYAKVIYSYLKESKTISELKNFTKLILFLFTAYSSILLLTRSRRLEREDEHNMARINKGFGFAMLFASLNYFMSVFYSYYTKETHQDIYPQVKYPMTLLNISFRFDQLLFLSLMLLSLLFMIYQIEITIGRKKFPVMTISLIISVLLNVGVIIYPSIANIAYIWLLYALVASILQLIYIYSKVIRYSKGLIRRKAFSTVFGIMLPIFMAIFGGILVYNYHTLSYMIANIISIIGFILVVYSMPDTPK